MIDVLTVKREQKINEDLKLIPVAKCQLQLSASVHFLSFVEGIIAEPPQQAVFLLTPLTVFLSVGDMKNGIRSVDFGEYCTQIDLAHVLFFDRQCYNSSPASDRTRFFHRFFVGFALVFSGAS
ncbi:hypothetical protein Runsl_0340 [Runella slithyformis DSM 19594]|uniref:Uncharacterized protein n=1 Tax=Runella slithyformis (strain ATCC 29530 / DSM 19594 / LMG 11500 / NCIMB 11436 / LSU 4) TaxID=761193 RepID=A0A7U3ZGN4_RUNSL|nr:hypothetical protein Runsl_0340 [Runella slithyformis DSM 19594]